MNMEKQKELLVMKKTTRSQLQHCEVLWGGRLSEICQSMDKNIIEGVKSGVSGHNTAKPCHSALDVNGAIGQRRLLTYRGLVHVRQRVRLYY